MNAAMNALPGDPSSMLELVVMISKFTQEQRKRSTRIIRTPALCPGVSDPTIRFDMREERRLMSLDT